MSSKRARGHIREMEKAIDTAKSEEVCGKEMMRKETAFAIPNGSWMRDIGPGSQ